MQNNNTNINFVNIEQKIYQYYFGDNNKDVNIDEGVKILLHSENQYLLQKIKYLYYAFTHNKEIVVKRKQNKLIQMLSHIMECQLDVIMLELKRIEVEQQEEVLDTLNKLVKIPIIITNHDPNKTHLINHVVNTIVREIVGFKNNSIKIQIINKLVNLGYLDNIMNAYNQQVESLILQNIDQIMKPYKLILFFMENNNQAKLSKFVKRLPTSEFPKMLLNYILYKPTARPSFAKIIANEIKNCGRQCVQHIFRSVLLDWSNKQFPRNAQPSSQKFLSNLLALLLENLDVQFLHQEDILKNVNYGITMRFQFFREYQFICQSGLIVWKKYAAKIVNENESFPKQLQEMCPIDLFQEEISSNKPIIVTHENTKVDNSKKLIIKEKQKQDQRPKQEYQQQPEQQQQFTEQEVNQFKIARPKNLYDCYLGLTSDKIERRQFCLKSVNFLVRNNIDDLIFLWQNLTNVLLKLQDQNNLIPKFDELKCQGLTALIIFRPVDVLRVIGDYFYKDSSLGHKITIVHTITNALVELGDNPKKYEKLKDDNSSNNASSFYFKKISSKYKKEEDVNKIKIEHERESRINEKSKRWGYTKKIYQQKNSQDLIPMTRNDLIIINQDSIDPYINQLYLIISEIFFTFILKLRNYPKLLNDKLFVVCLVKLLIVFAENIRNYHEKYKIIDEMIDIHQIIKSNDINVERIKLNLMLKISCALDKNIMRQELILRKFFSILDRFHDPKNEVFDPTFKMIVGLIEQNLKKVIQVM